MSPYSNWMSGSGSWSSVRERAVADMIAQIAGTQDFVLVTGPAGSGRSTVIRALEDLGFEAIDNLPLSLMPRLLGPGPAGRPLAVGVDPRTRDFGVGRLEALIGELGADQRLALTLLYVDCAPTTLLRRYSETRRRHPSSPTESPLVGIERELRMLAPLRARADVLIDTTAMTPHDLRAEIARLFAPSAGSEPLTVTLSSFSYKRGAPRDADMVIDCRFLANPHWQQDLRPLDGRDASVAAYIVADPRYEGFFARIADLVRFLLPAYQAEGKAYFHLALGCTGGRHRSVAVAEKLAKTLAEDGWQVSIHHRELETRAVPSAALQGV
jgi:RNase adapter protein RapZ